MRLLTILLLGVVVIALIGERKVSGFDAEKRDAIPPESQESETGDNVESNQFLREHARSKHGRGLEQDRIRRFGQGMFWNKKTTVKI